ncbi:trimethylamine methyltransferase family protein [Paralimibaculum aggregatum]|uniref:Methyltransferase n=1 Tax=Paralimibaculum aggregatum TaxID=3036245 RepID=A0ABQ6LF12_9RHOB|nr:trimethylamine methyltransferase family protein [Limibaculum sp. NKW23]GMG81918.1 trimethylamine methyltransferase family protein [Limibaculum sp. NKW23]
MTIRPTPMPAARAAEDDTSGGRRGRGRRSRKAGLVQPAWSRIENPLKPVEIFSEDQIEAIHETAMRVVEELGIELMSAPARALFRAAGAEVDEASGTVRLDRALLLELVARAPRRFSLTPRNPARALEIGGRSMVSTLVAGPPAVHDCIRGRRPSNLPDYRNFIRLAHELNAIHMLGNQVAAPIELPAETRHLDCYDANIRLTDKSFHCTAIGPQRARDGIAMMAIAKGMTLEEMAAEPAVSTIISVNSPRRFDDAMADGLIEMARHGQATAITPFTLMGAMTPVTLPAALAQQTAEALFGIALTQLARPGAPVMYGAFTSNVDMRTGAPAFGTPENAKANIASGQLARRYGLPYRATPSNASNAADAQAVWETQMSLWGCVMGGANMLYHGAGWLEGGLCASFEKVMLDAEMLNHIYAFLAPTEVDDDTLGFAALARVPTGGHFFGDAHTLARYETAFFTPMLADWRNHETWVADGAKTATERATAAWQQALADYAEPALPEDRSEALAAYVATRREEIARDGI